MILRSLLVPQQGSLVCGDADFIPFLTCPHYTRGYRTKPRTVSFALVGTGEGNDRSNESTEKSRTLLCLGTKDENAWTKWRTVCEHDDDDGGAGETTALETRCRIGSIVSLFGALPH